MIFSYIGVKCASETFVLGVALDTPTSPPVTFGLFNLIAGPYSSFGRKRALRTYKGLYMSLDCHGTVRVVFTSVTMGMGIYLHGVDTIIHYGAPSSEVEDYFQASGRRGQSGDSAYSIVYRTPKDFQRIAKKSPPFMIKNNKGTPHWLSYCQCRDPFKFTNCKHYSIFSSTQRS